MPENPSSDVVDFCQCTMCVTKRLALDELSKPRKLRPCTCWLGSLTDCSCPPDRPDTE